MYHAAAVGICCQMPELGPRSVATVPAVEMARSTPLLVSATNKTPSEPRARLPGPLNAAFVPVPSANWMLFAASMPTPPPANVVTVPPGEIARTTMLLVSDKNTMPAGDTTMPVGPLKRATTPAPFT